MTRTAYRSHDCGALRPADVGAEVRLAGWLHRKRDHGGLLFIDLRDHYGLTQLVFQPGSAPFAAAERARAESVLCVEGKVVARADETRNANLPTGAVEVQVERLELVSAAQDLPLPVFGEEDYPESTRLAHRYLDLRRARLHGLMGLRARVLSWLRRRMEADGFMEFQTPILTASSPEGARDFLVPSRLHPGRFYALPQAPQQFKQFLMLAGFDKYFQIAPCFRDEDARADRSPGEFYQLDIEMSFVRQEDVLAAVEPVLHDLFCEFGGGKKVSAPFPRLSWKEAMAAYGTDKPDLRIPLQLAKVSEVFRGGGFERFASLLEEDAHAEVWALPAPGGGSRAFCDRMNSWAQGEGQPGMGYLFFRDGAGQGPIAKNLGAAAVEEVRKACATADAPLRDGDAIFFCAGRPQRVLPFAAEARVKLGEELNLVARDRFAFCWIVDFPFYEKDPASGRIDFSHNPFSMPQGGLKALETQDPLTILGHQYDIVCNGVELSSGAIRNHRPDIMEKAFAIAGYSRAELEARFGGLFRALQHGAPPHGGIAPGLDRMLMLLADAEHLRDVIAFPMNQQAEDLLLRAPAQVSDEQLRILQLKVLKEVGEKKPRAAPKENGKV